MRRSTWPFINRVVHSHLGHVLVAVSWSFILFVLVRPHLTQPTFVLCVPANGEFYVAINVHYPIWSVAISVAHLPSIFFTQAVTKLLQGWFSLSCAPTAKVEMSLLFAFSAIQWVVVGYIIESFTRRVRSVGQRTQQPVGRERRERVS